MASDGVVSRIEDGVGIVELDRPAARNALSRVLLAALTGTLQRMDRDPAGRAVLTLEAMFRRQIVRCRVPNAGLREPALRLWSSGRANRRITGFSETTAGGRYGREPSASTPPALRQESHHAHPQ